MKINHRTYLKSLNEPKNNDLLYTCCLIEFIRRKKQSKSKDVVIQLGEEVIRHIYKAASVYHCQSFEHSASEILEMSTVEQGSEKIVLNDDNKPSYIEIGECYAYLILAYEYEDSIEKLLEIYKNEFITELIDDYETGMYWQVTSYLMMCIEAGKVLPY